jgi:hypothetical protein
MSEQIQPLNDLLTKYFTTPAAKHAPAVGTIRRAAFTPEIRGIDVKNRTIDFVASTEAVDRYGDILRVKGFQTANYMKNPVFLWAHKSGEPPIGKTLSISKELNPPALVQKVQFADAATYPFADQIFRLYQGKFMSAVSVGFIPLEQPEPILDADGRSTGGYEFTSQELLELSAVPIPANPEAVARALDERIVSSDDAAKVFVAPKSERLATAGDYVELAFHMGALSHSVENFLRVARATRSELIATPEDLERLVGRAGSISSVEALEKLFRLES